MDDAVAGSLRDPALAEFVVGAELAAISSVVPTPKRLLTVGAVES